jgi:hypothetical protein
MYNVIDMTTREEYLKGRCEVCGYYTFKNRERGVFEMCEVCLWEDDGYNDDPDEVRGGPNQDFSVNQARVNLKKFGAYSKHVIQYSRLPKEDELQS